MPAGEYTVLLGLPDPEPRLQQKTEYAIRLANKGLWDQQTGLHDLKQTMTVGQQKSAEPYRGKIWLEKAAATAAQADATE
jgi:hypothetical protein